MNDPWDVKSVRQSDQYISCMKLNGVPLLPPLLSKECREEMKYYKLLAREVEKRIEAFKSFFIESDANTSDDETSAPELPKSDQIYNLPSQVKTLEVTETKIKPLNLSQSIENGYENVKFDVSNTNENNSPTSSNISDSFSSKSSSKLVIDLSFSINDTARNLLDSNNTSRTPNDVPERECDCSNDVERTLIVDVDEDKDQEIIEDKLTFSVSINKEAMSDPITSFNFSQDGPPSLGAKSFTGSLNDLHIESVKEGHTIPLVRQRSYTVLKPSPLLLAHLEVQSLNMGVDVKSISMSESLSNVNSMNKKRRSWDLESAKVKWSSMALELKEKVKEKHLKNNINRISNPKPTIKKTLTNTPAKVTSLCIDKTKRNTTKPSTKSEPVQKPKIMHSPVRNFASQKVKHSTLPQSKIPQDISKQKLISESDDPATRVRELYEKIQKQQLVQMANLVEKQKREQMQLQQVFEEQNNLLFTQLKTICPKSPKEVKEAWAEKDTERGPVSLSQLINQKPENSHQSPMISTITETNNYINQCDEVLKKSRDVSESIKKTRPKVRQDGEKVVSNPGSRTRTHSPNARNTPASRKLVYDTSVSSDRDMILTDRTNDTFADLNVTFPSDHSDECPPSNTFNKIRTNIQALESPISAPEAASSCRSTDRAIKSMEETIQNSIKSMCGVRLKQNDCRPPTAQQRAAATKIVAYAKGYLVRRLMKTKRVQEIVQTIKDTLLLALQMHQDSNGIRGADVDLHRRLIQQITAACYTLHDKFVASSPSERCAIIAADRSRNSFSAAEILPPRHYRPTDVMSQSHSGAFPARPKRHSPALLAQSAYENFSDEKVRRYMDSPSRRPWR